MDNSYKPQEISKQHKITMFHDGECPLCSYEVKMMQKLDTKNAIRWVDICKDAQALEEAGITYKQAMDRIHVQDENQNMLTGVRGFLVVWKQLPYYRKVVPIIERIPFLLTVMESIYTLFAKYRLAITGKKQLSEDIN